MTELFAKGLLILRVGVVAMNTEVENAALRTYLLCVLGRLVEAAVIIVAVMTVWILVARDHVVCL